MGREPVVVRADDAPLSVADTRQLSPDEMHVMKETRGRFFAHFQLV